MTILQNIIDYKKTLLPTLLQNKPNFHVVPKKRPSLYEVLRKTDRLQIIAEMKRASPSKGVINDNVDPIKQAQQYEKAGAACISVLTEDKFFKGSYEDLAQIANNVNIPLLNKDFIIHEVQIDYAKASGASVILLIVAALNDDQLKSLYDYATKEGLDVLVEVHNEEEVERALAINPKIIGVNNRDLKTFHVDLAQTEKLANHILQYEDIVFISESGIWDEKDAERVSKAGASAILVGESLMKSENVEEAISSFQVPLPTTKVVK